MDVRDKVPSARMQAAMALRYHVREGNLKWVSLLLRAGADPRLVVPDLERMPAEEIMGTALEEAVKHYKVEIMKKIPLDLSRDDEQARMFTKLSRQMRGAGDGAPVMTLGFLKDFV